MWLELGGNVLIDLDCFSYFGLCYIEGLHTIVGLLDGHEEVHLYATPDADDARAKFEMIRKALYHKQCRLNDLLGLETDELVSGVGRALREEFEDSIGVS